ncbi:MAG: thiol protease/hemagglutinin PrtT [Bacteroidota bacterium]
MKKTYIILSTFLMSIGNLSIYAKQVDINNAQTVALNCYYEKVNTGNIVAFNNIAVTETFTVSDALSNPVYYIFNFGEKGFVIVSAENATTPIIGYSLEGAYSDIDQPEVFQEWMQQYKEGIIYVRENKLTANSESTTQWEHYLSTSFVLNSAKNVLAVGPLLTSKWDQISPYNDMCPAASGGPAGSNGHALTGCVATSMSQVMYYYKWPITGVGSHTSTHDGRIVNPGATTYQWSQMVDIPTAANSAIATLMYHCGVVVNMQYGANVSLSDSQYAVTGMVEHFKYHSSMQKLYRTQYSGNWATLLKSNLDKKRPVIYGGTCSAMGGHSWICDGYDASGKFHMNWGFGNKAPSSYYDVDNFNAGGFIGSVSNHKALVNIYPLTLPGVEEDIELSSTLNVYPNPTENQLNISFNSNSMQNIEIDLTSLVGQTIFSDVNNKFSGSEYSKTIDLSSVAKGIYILRIITENGIANRKVIVE